MVAELEVHDAQIQNRVLHHAIRRSEVVRMRKAAVHLRSGERGLVIRLLIGAALLQLQRQTQPRSINMQGRIEKGEVATSNLHAVEVAMHVLQSGVEIAMVHGVQIAASRHRIRDQTCRGLKLP